MTDFCRRAKLALISTAFTLAGCAVHPRPEDVTRIKTLQIAEHIRCEARDAIEAKAIQMLRRAAREKGPKGEPPILDADELADRLSADPTLFAHARPLLKNKREMEFYDRYIKTSIAYDFTFDMAEDNQASTQVDFIKLLTTSLSPNSTFGIGLSASNDRMRENIRKFLVTDKFEDLLTKPLQNCDSAPIGENLVYPIVGRIGLDELISTFIDLNEEVNLTPKDKAPALADQLQFNTTFLASATPKVVLTPMGSAFRLADASLTNTESRTDKHAVIIGLSLEPKTKAAPRPSSPYLGVGLLTRSIFATRNLSAGQVRAVEAIAQFRIDLYYDRSASVAVR